MAKRKEELPPPGAPAWMATFGDLMNLLLCFYVLLFSMSTIDAEKLKQVAESFSQTFSIFDSGATAIGDGLLISNGVSQLNELDEYINSTGKPAESEVESDQVNEYENLAGIVEAEQLKESEALAEKISESLFENNLTDVVNVEFNSQYVQLTLKGALLFDSAKATIRKDALPVVEKIAVILDRYAANIIEIEGHTDNVPMSGTKYSNNEELSCGRALAVYNYMIEHTSLDPANFKYSGRGEAVPVADNSTAEGRAKNRRVEIRIYNDLSNYR